MTTKPPDLVDAVELEKELAEDYRRQVQEADARKLQWSAFDHAAFVAWVEANTEALKQIAIDNGTVADEAAAAIAVAGYQEDIREVPALAPYDDLSAYLIMRRLVEEIEQACAALNVPTRSGVVFGTAPMLGVQAHQSSVQTLNASVIGVSPAFLPFCDLVSKALAVSLTIDLNKQTISNDPEEFRTKLNSRPDLTLLWARTLFPFAIYGLPPPKLDRRLSLPEGRVRLDLLRAIELFAFGHEYGHHALRHGTQSPVGETNRLSQEQEADFFGQAVAKYVGSTSTEPNFYAISGAGGVAILSALRLIRRVRAVLSTGAEEAEDDVSHPPLDERVMAILSVHDNESKEAREAYADMCDCFREIFDIVWGQLKPICSTLHTQGTRPHDAVVASGEWLPLNA